MNAAIDANTRDTWTAYNDTTGQIERVYCDPVTNALLVFGVAADGNTPTAINRALIDGNTRNAATGFNDTSGLIEAFRCGNGGELLVKAVS